MSARDSSKHGYLAWLTAGALIGVAAVGVLGAFWYASREDLASARRTDAADVVVAFVAPAEDGASVAQIVMLVSDSSFESLVPETTVTVPGTSLVPLGDAYPLGGGRALAAGVSSITQVENPAHVVVPQGTWVAAVDANSDLKIDVIREVSVFDGRQVVRIGSGRQRLDGSQIGAVMRALPYLEPDERRLMRERLQKGLVAALADDRPPHAAVETDLNERTYTEWRDSVLFKTTAP